jgi:hypothetical protein
MSDELKVQLLMIANDIAKNDEFLDKKVVYNANKVIGIYWTLREQLQDVDGVLSKSSSETLP